MIKKGNDIFAQSFSNPEPILKPNAGANQMCAIQVPSWYWKCKAHPVWSLSFCSASLEPSPSASSWYAANTDRGMPRCLEPRASTSTSSAAQGGGGSFKNRKPIGEVGCCESRMAERIHWWTERWLELCFLEWLQWLQWSPGRSPHPRLLDVVWCSAAVVAVVVAVVV